MKHLIRISFFLFFFANLSIYAQWTDVSTPSTWSLDKASFADENTGYIIKQFQPKIFRTTNGGITWDSLTFHGGGAWDVDFVSASTGFVLVDSSAIYSINTTTDGGNSWTNDTLPDNYYNIIRYTDANTGFVASNYGSVYHTTNAGTSWTQLSMGGYSSGTDKEFTGPDTIIFSGWDGSFGYQGSIIRRDGAGTFQERIFPMTYSSFQGTFFLSGNNGYAAFTATWPSFKNYLVHTTNGGTSWDTVLTDTTSTIIFNDVWMNASGQGFIAATNGSGGAIFKVTGTTKTIDLNAPHPLRRIHMGGSMLFAVGDNGSVFKSSKLVGVENEVKELKGIYPNPTSDLLKIPVDEVSEVRLVNMNGQVVLNKNVSPGDLISLQEFAPGTYTVFVVNSKGKSSAKIIIKK